MWKQLIIFFKDLFFPDRCEKCKSTTLHKSSGWTRGWNNLCEQATGDSGTRCFDCGHIKWDQSLEEYKSKLPEWCVAYEDKK